MPVVLLLKHARHGPCRQGPVAAPRARATGWIALMPRRRSALQMKCACSRAVTPLSHVRAQHVRMPSAANTPREPAPLRLRTGEFLPLRDAHGRTVTVVRGRLWIARDDGRHVAFLGRGQTFSFDRPGAATLHALETSSLRLSERGAAAPRGVWRQRLHRVFRLLPIDATSTRRGLA
jgi:Protein of unknown function (DUF2917)